MNSDLLNVLNLVRFEPQVFQLSALSLIYYATVLFRNSIEISCIMYTNAWRGVHRNDLPTIYHCENQSKMLNKRIFIAYKSKLRCEMSCLDL